MLPDRRPLSTFVVIYSLAHKQAGLIIHRRPTAEVCCGRAGGWQDLVTEARTHARTAARRGEARQLVRASRLLLQVCSLLPSTDLSIHPPLSAFPTHESRVFSVQRLITLGLFRRKQNVGSSNVIYEQTVNSEK